jgi:phage recombination protein Bet
MNEIVQVTADKISTLTGFSSQEVAIAKQTVAKNTTDAELAFFLNVAKSTGLNPFNKEIWCYKDHRNNLIVFTGRDGLSRKAQEHPMYAGMRSSEVCEKDHFKMDIFNNKIEHSFGLGDRGKIVGAFAIAFRVNGEPTIEWAEFDRFYRGKKRDGSLIPTSPWNTSPADMIKKVPESKALKKAFALAQGVQLEYDWHVESDKVMPIGAEELKDDVKILRDKILLFLDEYTGKDKEEIRENIVKAIKNKEFTIEFAEEIAKDLGIEI